MDWMPVAIRDGIIVILLISGPLVLTAAFIGLTIGILQAATQVQEQTIGSALKIIGVFALIIFAGFWMYQYLSQYAERTISAAFTFVPTQTQKAVPGSAFEEDKFGASFEEEASAPLELIEPERLEVEEIPDGGVPPGVPYLGQPEIPKATKPFTKVVPPKIPDIPMPQTIKPLPQLDFQEPRPLITPRSLDSQTDSLDTQSETDNLSALPWDRDVDDVVSDVKEEDEKLPSWLE